MQQSHGMLAIAKLLVCAALSYVCFKLTLHLHANTFSRLASHAATRSTK